MEIESESTTTQLDTTQVLKETVERLAEGRESLKEELGKWNEVIEKNLSMANEIELQKEKLTKAANKIKGNLGMKDPFENNEGRNEEGDSDELGSDPLNSRSGAKKIKRKTKKEPENQSTIKREEPSYLKTLAQITDLLMDEGIDLRKISSFTESNRTRFSLGFESFLQEERPMPPPAKLKNQPDASINGTKDSSGSGNSSLFKNQVNSKFQNGSRSRRRNEEKGSSNVFSMFSSIPGIESGISSKMLEQLNQKNPNNEYFVEKFKMKSLSESDQILTKHNLEIKGHDLLKLHPDVYLNDTIINFFLKFLTNEVLSEEMMRRTYIFNTYFIGQIREKVFAIEDWVNDSENYEKLVQTTDEDFKNIHKKFSKVPFIFNPPSFELNWVILGLLCVNQLSHLFSLTCLFEMGLDRDDSG